MSSLIRREKAGISAACYCWPGASLKWQAQAVLIWPAFRSSKHSPGSLTRGPPWQGGRAVASLALQAFTALLTPQRSLCSADERSQHFSTEAKVAPTGPRLALPNLRSTDPGLGPLSPCSGRTAELHVEQRTSLFGEC